MALTIWPLLDWFPAKCRLVWEGMYFAAPMICELLNNSFPLLENVILLGYGSIYITGSF